MEKEFEVWTGNNRKDSLRLILLLPVCAVDDEPGTKLQEGDGKTPEGFYNAAIAYGSSADFMWIKLNNKDIDTYGSVGLGSSFKMCLDYPNSLDQLQTKTLMKHNRPGSAICIHGNCVSIGCISFKNRNYLPVFLSALYHDSKNYGTLKIHIFPFRFDNITDEKRKKLASKVARMTEKQALEKWENLEKAYNLFNEKHKVFNIGISKDKYIFSPL
jgi:murein L,D-transpeptidase YafK